MTAVAVCGVLLSSSGCDAPPARAAQVPAATTTWRTLGQWAGAGSRQTESFDVVSGALRLQWEVRGTTAGAGPFRVWLYSAISGRPLQLVVEHKGPGTGTAHLADDPRVSYLVIEGEGATWTAVLHEAAAQGAAGR
ncbi:MAG: hypothetical protein IT181_25345 [Acidobacteria bacterium]|nr:hypothetical protein [Acidobacteriota bacterium]